MMFPTMQHSPAVDLATCYRSEIYSNVTFMGPARKDPQSTFPTPINTQLQPRCQGSSAEGAT